MTAVIPPSRQGSSRDKTGRALAELLESTSDSAYSVDERGRISGWNAAAQQFLGYLRGEVVGRPCHELLRGRDLFGNPFCQPDCPLLLLARQRQPMRHFQMDLCARDGTARRVQCFVLNVRDCVGSWSIVHVIGPVERLPLPTVGASPHQLPLTERELEVLRMLAAGRTTHAIADTMSVTTSTVRKHVEHLLQKLGVRNRLAAVMVALENGLL